MSNKKVDDAKKNNANTIIKKVTSIWCSTCGDTSVYSPKICWAIKDEERGIGICCFCAEVLDREQLVLPDISEDGYAKFN